MYIIVDDDWTSGDYFVDTDGEAIGAAELEITSGPYAGQGCWKLPTVVPAAYVKRFDISEYDVSARKGDVYLASGAADCKRAYPNLPPLAGTDTANWVALAQNAHVSETITDLVGTQIIYKNGHEDCTTCDDYESARVQVKFTESSSGNQLLHEFPAAGGGANEQSSTAKHQWPTYFCEIINLNTSILTDSPNNKARLKFGHKLTMVYSDEDDAGSVEINYKKFQATCTTNTTERAYSVENEERMGEPGVADCGVLSGVDLVSGTEWNEYEACCTFEKAECVLDNSCHQDCEGQDPTNNITKNISPKMGSGAHVVSVLTVECALYEDVSATPPKFKPSSTTEMIFTGPGFEHNASVYVRKGDSGTGTEFPPSSDWVAASTATSFPNLNFYSLNSEDDLVFSHGFANKTIGSIVFTPLEGSATLEVMAEDSQDWLDVFTDATPVPSTNLSSMIDFPEEISDPYKSYSETNVTANGGTWKEGKIKISALTGSTTGFVRGDYRLKLVYSATNSATSQDLGEASVWVKWNMPSTFFVADPQPS